jgi:hypothetical protein
MKPTRKLELWGFGLHTRRLGDKVRRGTNPFTGEPFDAPIDDGLDDAERSRVRAILAEQGATGPDPDGYYYIQFEDGTRLGLGFGELDGAHPVVGAAVEITGRHVSEGLLTLVLRIAREANMVLYGDDPNAVVLTHEPVDSRIQQRWPAATMIHTPAELRAWFEASVGSRPVFEFD